MTNLINWLQSFEFIWPWMLAFLPLPWILKPFLKPAAQSQIPLFAPQILQRLNAISTSKFALQKPKANRNQAWLFTLLWILLIFAAMRPVWFLTPTPFESSGRDMILSVDLSGSMQKPDMQVRGRNVDRLVALKSVVSKFISQREGDRLGLVVFGSQAFLVSPLTYDLNAIQILLEETQIGMAGSNTAIGDSIGLTLKHLKANQNKKAVLILLTDGSNNAGSVDPIDAAKQAKNQGLVIHTIAFGDVKPEAIKNPELARAGEIDILALQEIADITGGQAFIANQTSQLDKIYQQINQIETSDFTLNQYRARTELYTYPLGLALILSFFWVVFVSYQPKIYTRNSND